MSVAKEIGVTFIDNDLVFKLKDGSSCDAFLKDDGVNLSSSGTQQLAKNLELRIKAGCERNICKQAGKHNKVTNRQATNGQADRDTTVQNVANDEGWQLHAPKLGRRGSPRNSPDKP